MRRFLVAIIGGMAAVLASPGLASATHNTAVRSLGVSGKLPSVVRGSAEKCSVNLRTHTAKATGEVSWADPAGSGALGTVSVTWTGPHRYKVHAAIPEMFEGRWSVVVPATRALAACKLSGTFAAPTAETTLAFLQARGLPITGVIAYNATTDPNHLLGRPNGYLSKVAWQDTRLSQTGQSADPGGVEWGGSIEVFRDHTMALARANYIGALEQASPLFGSEYDYILGPVLMRISGTLTPAQAQTSYAAAIPEATLFTYRGSAGS